MKRKLIWIIPAGIAAIALFAFLGGEVVEHLWNWLLPPLFGFKQITFWQGLGMLALCRILFGGFGGSSNHSKGRDRKKGMTPEERQRIRERLCNPDAPAAEAGTEGAPG